MTRSQPRPGDAPPVDRQGDNPMTGITAALATITAADELNTGVAEIDAAIARSAWGSVPEMLTREFEGGYRGYYPKCAMDVFDEAAIAAVFDALAELLGDARRAVRAGGRADG